MAGKLEGKVAFITGVAPGLEPLITGLEFTVDAGNTIR